MKYWKKQTDTSTDCNEMNIASDYENSAFSAIIKYAS